MVEFLLLGPVQLRAGNRVLDLGSPKQRTVAAALAVDAGRPVTVDTLVDRVWGEDPPVEARNALYAHIMRIRRTLSQAEGAHLQLVRGPAGYTLDIDPDRVDLHRFRRRVQQARDQDNSDEARARLLRQALDLWHSMPMADLAGAWVTRVRDNCRQQRLDATLSWARVELRLGNHEMVLARVTELIDEYPLVEPLTAVLMRALYAAGRAAEALVCYTVMRQRLADELGTDPGPELQALHQMILRGGWDDTTTTLSRLPAPAAPQAWNPPAQLPADVRGFIGRGFELAQLDSILAAVGQQPTSVVISALCGTAGVGKTALAVHWAHRVAAEFPDGHLYVNLRGFGPPGSTLSPAEAIRGFLDALGVPRQRIPVDPDAQAALYRSLLAGRRVLVVLDNAREAEQVRPLLPGAPGCLVVVTSRNQPLSLVAVEGAYPLTLDLLSRAEARELLACRLGEDRVAAEPQAVEEIITRCARLPLALAIVAARAGAHPGFPLATLADELGEARGGLDALDAGDTATSVRTVFSWSYQTLRPDAARLFRLLGLHPGPDIAVLAAASLAGVSAERTHRLLRELAHVHLLAEPAPGRFAFHDLLRAYAGEQARMLDSHTKRRRALARLFDHYLTSAATAMDILAPAELHRRPRIPAPATGTLVTTLATAAEAQAWLDVERANLVAITAYTATHGWPDHTTRLAATLFRYLERSGHYSDALTVHTHALDAARHTGDRAAQAHALISLCGVYWRQGRYQQAANHIEQALDIFREVGDRLGQTRALSNLGLVFWRQGRYQQAADHHRQALDIARRIGARDSEIGTLDNLGLVFWRQGRYRQAADHHRRALDIAREIGDRDGEARALDHLGLVLWRQGSFEQAAHYEQQALTLYRELGERDGEAGVVMNLGLIFWRQGHYQRAADHHRRALAIYREVGDRDGEARALDHLGLVHQQLGRHEQAAERHRLALTIFQELDDLSGQAETRNHLGESLSSGGRPERACSQHWRALALASEIGDHYQQARAHNGLGHAHHAHGDLDQAGRHWRHALCLYTDLGVPDADRVRSSLANL